MADEKNPYESDYSPSPTTTTPKKSKNKEVVPKVDFDVNKTYGTPPALLDNLEKVESSGDATAINTNSIEMKDMQQKRTIIVEMPEISDDLATDLQKYGEMKEEPLEEVKMQEIMLPEG
jgi:hypothetical protein